MIFIEHNIQKRIFICLNKALNEWIGIYNLRNDYQPPPPPPPPPPPEEPPPLLPDDDGAVEAAVMDWENEEPSALENAEGDRLVPEYQEL